MVQHYNFLFLDTWPSFEKHLNIYMLELWQVQEARRATVCILYKKLSIEVQRAFWRRPLASCPALFLGPSLQTVRGEAYCRWGRSHSPVMERVGHLGWKKAATWVLLHHFWVNGNCSAHSPQPPLASWQLNTQNKAPLPFYETQWHAGGRREGWGSCNCSQHKFK